MNQRKQILAFVGVVAVLAIFGIFYVMWASGRSDADLAEREEQARSVIDEFEDQGGLLGDAARRAAEADAAGPGPQPGEVLVVHRAPGDDYGRLAIRHADGTRTMLDRRCMRVHAAQGNGVCLAEEPDAILPSFRTEYFDAADDRLVTLRSFSSPLPSRARMSPDGSLATTTGFVSGVSYEDIAAGTETVASIEPIGERGKSVGLLQFDIESDDGGYDSAERQFWGVTFADSDRFWVTGWFGDGPEVLEGSVEDRVLRPTGWAGSCPSVSPDGSTLIYKRSREEGGFDLVARTLDSGEEWILGETRSVDDQVEWLDNDTILYALHPEGEADESVQPRFDIWSLDIAAGSEPELFLPGADSPAVIHSR